MAEIPRYWISTLIESKSNLPTRSYLYPWLWLAAGDYRRGGRRRERRQGKDLIDGGASRRYFSATRYHFIIPRHRSSIIRNHFLAHSLSASGTDQFKFCSVVHRRRIRAFTHKKWISLSFSLSLSLSLSLVISVYVDEPLIPIWECTREELDVRIRCQNWMSTSIYSANHVRIKYNYYFLYQIFYVAKFRYLNYGCIMCT